MVVQSSSKRTVLVILAGLMFIYMATKRIKAFKQTSNWRYFVKFKFGLLQKRLVRFMMWFILQNV